MSLCMETLVQDIIIGNIPGARGADVTFDTEHNHDLECVSDSLQMIPKLHKM